MSQLIDFEKEMDKHTWFSHLVLQTVIDSISEITDSEDYDPSKLQVTLKINNVEIEVKDFNSVLEDWSKRIEEAVKKELKFNEKLKSVEKAAEILIKEKLNNLRETLDNIEDSLYKLYD